MAEINTYFCRFCGQAIYDVECDESATLKCDCPQAKEYHKQREAISNATHQVFEVLHDNAGIYGFSAIEDNGILTLATDAAKLIIVSDVSSVTFVIANDSTIKINGTSKNTIKVERKRTVIMNSEG